MAQFYLKIVSNPLLQRVFSPPQRGFLIARIRKCGQMGALAVGIGVPGRKSGFTKGKKRCDNIIIRTGTSAVGFWQAPRLRGPSAHDRLRRR